MRNKISILFFFIIAIPLFAQEKADFDSLQIENSPDYYWGKGRSTQKQVAEEVARAEFSDRIVTFLSSSIEVKSETTVSGNEVKEKDFINKSTKRFSALNPTGLEKRVFETKSGFVCWVYIAKTVWEKSLIDLSDKIENLVNEADIELKKNNVNNALSIYYKGYLLGFSSPKELYRRNSQDNTDKISLNTYIENSLRKILTGASIKVLKPQPIAGDDTEFKIPLQFELNGSLLSFIEISVEGQQAAEVVDGRSSITVPHPKFMKEEKGLILKPQINTQDFLKEIDRRFGFTLKRSIEIDFSSIIKLNIAEKISGNVVNCTIESENLNIVDVSWTSSFGNKATSMAFKTEFGTEGQVVVKLKINNSSELTISKTINNPSVNPRIEVAKEVNKEVTKEVVKEVKKEVVKESALPVEPKVIVSPSTVEVPNSKVESILKGLAEKKENFADFMELLKKHQSDGVVSFGKRSDFANSDNCFIAFADGATNSIVAILSPISEGKRKEKFSGEIIENPGEKYKGKRTVWFTIQ